RLAQHPPYGSLALRHTDEHVVQAAYLTKDSGVLVCADQTEARDLGDAQSGDLLAVETDRTAVYGMGAGDRVEQGRLPRSVGADQARDASLADGQAYPIIRDDAAEALGSVANLEQGGQSARLPLGARAP